MSLVQLLKYQSFTIHIFVIFIFPKTTKNHMLVNSMLLHHRLRSDWYSTYQIFYE